MAKNSEPLAMDAVKNEVSQNGSGKRPANSLFYEEIGDVTLCLTPDFQETYDAYYRRLLKIRGIPQTIDAVQPGDPLIKYIAQQPEISLMPEKTASDKEWKARAIQDELVMYYESAQNATRSDAMVLAMTAYNNEFTEEPTPYPAEVKEALPGIMALPEIRKDLHSPLERRLKQALDGLAKTPQGVARLVEVMRTFAVRMTMEASKDDAGFHTGSAD